MVEPQPDRIDHRAKAEDGAVVDQPPEPHLRWRLGQADTLGEIGDGDPPVLGQHLKDSAIETVDFTIQCCFISLFGFHIAIIAAKKIVG
jgi:hypothetical protein